MTNLDYLRTLPAAELAYELTRNPSIPCRICEYVGLQGQCLAPSFFPCCTKYAEALTRDWLEAEF